MPNIADVVLNDGAADITYSVVKAEPDGVSVFADKSLGIKALESTLTISSKEKANGGHRVMLKHSTPIIVTDSGTSTQYVDGYNVATLQFDWAKNSSAAQRSAIIAQMADAFDVSQTLLDSVFADQETLY